MKEQIYIIESQESFCLKHIFECGQCFRWNIEEDGSYTGVFKNNVCNVKQKNNKIIFNGIWENDARKIIYHYFDLERNYESIKEQLSLVDKNVAQSIKYGNGIRLLNQDLWETLISFIISANNNIPRIKKIIENLSRSYGKEIIWNNKKYYTFPSPKELSVASILDLRNLGLGFRDKYIYKVTQMINNEEFSLEELKNIANVNELRKKLMKLPGVGEKVADCVMLFSDLKKLEVFPIDVWVRRVMNELYIKDTNEKNVHNEQIRKLAEQKYKGLAGIAQQYLFYWKREA